MGVFLSTRATPAPFFRRYPAMPMSRFFVRLTLSFTLASAAMISAAPPPPASAYVRAEGRQLIDPSGQPLVLRGTNLGNWLLPEGYMFTFKRTGSPQQIDTAFAELLGDLGAARFWHAWQEHYITEADIRFIQATGANHVRVPFNWRLLVTPDYPHRMEGPGWARLDDVIRWCRDAGLYVVLDLHGAPDGQTGANIDDSRGRPLLFESDAAADLTVELWEAIATRYRDETIIAGYDLLNEPIAHYFDTERYNPRLLDLYRRLVTAIRAIDPHHTLFLGGAQWNTNLAMLGAPIAPNLVYTFHLYWDEPVQASIQRFLDVREQHDVPLYLGESGENTDDWIETFRTLLDTHDIGWAFWPYKKMGKSSCFTTVPTPAGWDAIAAYAEAPRGDYDEIRAALPDLDSTRATFAALLDGIRLENTTVNPGYLDALGLTVPDPVESAPAID